MEETGVPFFEDRADLFLLAGARTSRSKSFDRIVRVILGFDVDMNLNFNVDSNLNLKFNFVFYILI